jgi:serine/threonine-protein kinase RsbT
MTPSGQLEQRVTGVLRRYMSEILAQSVRRRAQLAIGVAEGALQAEHLSALREKLEGGVRLFVEPTLQRALLEELERLTESPDVPLVAERITIEGESDISRARLRARDLVVALGGTSFVAQRAATVASELSRNIVAYAQEGVLELRPSLGPPASLTVRAVDRGPGISDVEAVLSGHYRSRTGLGKGLAGVKRLAARFDVQSGTKGTRVEAEIAW